MGDLSELKSEVARNKSIRLLIHSDGDGQTLDVVGDETLHDSALTERLDVTFGALGALGESMNLGEIATSIVFYKDGFLVLGTSRKGDNVAVLASDNTSAGLILAQLRTVLTRLDE
jgi:hypothetical protein